MARNGDILLPAGLERVLDKSDKENPELNMQSHVEQVRKLLEKQGVKIPSECNQFIVRCIRVKCYDVEKAASLVKNFGIMLRMNDAQELFSNCMPSQLKGLFDCGAIVPLAQHDSHGRFVMVSHAGSWDTNQFNFDMLLAGLIILSNYAVGNSEELQHAGGVIIFNFDGWGLRHIRALKVKRLSLVVKLLQNSCPGKIKGIHLINHPRVISMVFMLIKPLLKAKLASRIFFHLDEKSLHQVIPSNILPDNLGGKTKSTWVDNNLVYDLMQSNEYSREMLKVGYPAY